jgi:hypothetical protein
MKMIVSAAAANNMLLDVLLFPLHVLHHTTPHHTRLRHFTSVFSDNCATMTPIIVYEDDCVSSSSVYRTSGSYSYRYLFFKLTQVGYMNDVCSQSIANDESCVATSIYCSAGY